MSEDLIKQLAEEAKQIQKNSIKKEELNLEEETEDIDYEEIKEILFDVYNEEGKLIKIKESELDLYISCVDNSLIIKSKLLKIDGYRYNPFTETIIKDYKGYDYIEKYPRTWRKFILFDEEGEYKIGKVSVLLAYSIICDYTSYHEAYVNKQDLEKYNYYIDGNGRLKKRKSLEEFKKELFETYPFFEQTINSLYRDHWDINFEKVAKNYCVIIKFDEFTITNSKRQTHLIKDLYVLIPFIEKNNKIVMNNSLYGGRGLISNAEYELHYKHSHLSNNWDNISNFCLGVGPINKYILDFNLKPDENSLFSVLYNIKIFVEWESIEGTPHRYIGRLSKEEIPTYENLSINFNDLFNKYLQLFKLPLRIHSSNNSTQFKLDENILENELLIVYPSAKVYRDKTTGKYFKEQGLSKGKEIISENPLLTYKGEVIKTKTYNTNIKNAQETEYVVHPSVTKQFVENALKRIRNYYFKKVSGIDTGKSKYYNI